MEERTVAGVCRAAWTRISSFCRPSLVADVKSDIVAGCLLQKIKFHRLQLVVLSYAYL